MTVLACHLLSVPAHAAPLDREARLEVVRDGYALWPEVMQRVDGHLAQFQGERMLEYFGYPRAHEDAAQRAVLAGFGLIEGIGPRNRPPHQHHGGRLAVQVGIHTSVELVGAMGRGYPPASLVVGETPTMAARLQRLAGPDTVVISPATGRLVDGYVCCAILGTHWLEDRSEPVTVYRVLLALTLYLAAALHRDRAEAEAARQRAEAAIALATAQGFPHWVQSQHC